MLVELLSRWLEDDQKMALFGHQIFEGNNLHIDHRHPSVVSHAQPFSSAGHVAFSGVVNSRAQRQHQALAQHLEQIDRWLSRGRLEITASVAAELHYVQMGID